MVGRPHREDVFGLPVVDPQRAMYGLAVDLLFEARHQALLAVSARIFHFHSTLMVHPHELAGRRARVPRITPASSISVIRFRKAVARGPPLCDLLDPLARSRAAVASRISCCTRREERPCGVGMADLEVEFAESGLPYRKRDPFTRARNTIRQKRSLRHRPPTPPRAPHPRLPTTRLADGLVSRGQNVFLSARIPRAPLMAMREARDARPGPATQASSAAKNRGFACWAWLPGTGSPAKPSPMSALRFVPSINENSRPRSCFGTQRVDSDPERTSNGVVLALVRRARGRPCGRCAHHGTPWLVAHGAGSSSR